MAAGFVNIGNNIYCGNVEKYYADKLGEEGFCNLGYGIKANWYDSPYLRLTAETKIAIPDGMSLGFKPPAFNSFLSDWDETYILLDFEFSVQAALGIFN